MQPLAPPFSGEHRLTLSAAELQRLCDASVEQGTAEPSWDEASEDVAVGALEGLSSPPPLSSRELRLAPARQGDAGAEVGGDAGSAGGSGKAWEEQLQQSIRRCWNARLPSSTATGPIPSLCSFFSAEQLSSLTVHTRQGESRLSSPKLLQAQADAVSAALRLASSHSVLFFDTGPPSPSSFPPSPPVYVWDVSLLSSECSVELVAFLALHSVHALMPPLHGLEDALALVPSLFFHCGSQRRMQRLLLFLRSVAHMQRAVLPFASSSLHTAEAASARVAFKAARQRMDAAAAPLRQRASIVALHSSDVCEWLGRADGGEWEDIDGWSERSTAKGRTMAKETHQLHLDQQPPTEHAIASQHHTPASTATHEQQQSKAHSAT